MVFEGGRCDSLFWCLNVEGLTATGGSCRFWVVNEFWTMLDLLFRMFSWFLTRLERGPPTPPLDDDEGEKFDKDEVFCCWILAWFWRCSNRKIFDVVDEIGCVDDEGDGGGEDSLDNDVFELDNDGDALDKVFIVS